MLKRPFRILAVVLAMIAPLGVKTAIASETLVPGLNGFKAEIISGDKLRVTAIACVPSYGWSQPRLHLVSNAGGHYRYEFKAIPPAAGQVHPPGPAPVEGQATFYFMVGDFPAPQSVTVVAAVRKMFTPISSGSTSTGVQSCG